MVKIDILDKKDKIKDRHKKDFCIGHEDYKRINLSMLSKYESFYGYFYNKNNLNKNNLENLLCADSKVELKKIISKIEPLIKKDAKAHGIAVEIIKKEIKSCFEKMFSNFSQRRWAYQYLQLINCKVCPYCNRAYTFTLYKKNSKVKPELDHYFPKNIYPYLAISIFNLVPACSSCNKGKSDKECVNICYPYEEGFEDKENNILFTSDFETIEAIFIEDKKLTIKLDDDNNVNKKAYIDKYNSAFKIDNLYQEHEDYLREIIQKAIIFDEDFFESIYSSMPELFGSYKEVKRVIFGNYLEPNEIGNRPLAKMTQDILKEFCEIL